MDISGGSYMTVSLSLLRAKGLLQPTNTSKSKSTAMKVNDTSSSFAAMNFWFIKTYRDVGYVKFLYEIIHICTAVVDESEI